MAKDKSLAGWCVSTAIMSIIGSAVIGRLLSRKLKFSKGGYGEKMKYGLLDKEGWMC